MESTIQDAPKIDFSMKVDNQDAPKIDFPLKVTIQDAPKIDFYIKVSIQDAQKIHFRGILDSTFQSKINLTIVKDLLFN